MTATLHRPRAAAPPGPPSPSGPPPRPATRAAPAGGVGNVALVALTLAAVVALSRLFTRPTRFFFPVATVAVAVHVVAWACRRARLELFLSALLSVLAGAVVTSWVALGQTTAYGIPWRGTYHALGPTLQAAADAYRGTSPPTAVIAGFLIAGAVGAIAAAFLGDWAAFRMRATTEACLPSFSLFVLAAALSQGHEVVMAGATWLGTVLVFLLVRQGAVDLPPTAWFASRRRSGRTIVVGSGALMLAATVATTAVIGPHLPGATTHYVINWRTRSSSNSGRTTISPLVDIKSRLHDSSNVEVFTVQSHRPTYWRITALDTFKGSGWSLNDTYRHTGQFLPATDGSGTSLPADAGPTVPETATFQVSSLDSLWLPAPYRPYAVHGVGGLSYSAAAASIITSKPTSDGLTYTVASGVPAATAAELAQASPPDPTDPALEPYLQLPADLSPVVRRLASIHTAGATTEYAKAKALQDWLRGPTFQYSLNVPGDDTANALVDFLTRTRAGFCQQFAGAFAVLARSIGLPTRVAVGFTQGTVEGDGLYHVANLDAHAWPEVWFPVYGWVGFEPTPGRGSPDPAAINVTGVTPAEAVGNGPPTTTPVTGPAPTPKPGLGSPDTTPKGRSGATNPAQRSHPHHPFIPAFGPLTSTPMRTAGSLLGLVVLWGLVVTGAGAALVTVRRRRAPTPGARVRVAWTETEEALTLAGTPPHAWETSAEYARRAAARAVLPREAADALARLGETVTYAAYAPAAPDDAAADGAARDAAAVARAAAQDPRWWMRLVRWLDPRPLALVMRNLSPGA